MSIGNIMTVCVGNICRSPVAEGFLRRAFPDRKVWSAGLAAVVGAPADETAAELARMAGLDLAAHRAQQVQAWMCTQAELILVMESSHKEALEDRFPLARGKIRRLGEYGPNGSFDIADPYRQPRAAFEAAHQAIEAGVAEWVRRIRLVS